MTIAERLAFAPELRDMSNWPRATAVPEAKRALFERRCRAVAAYLGGASFAEVEAEHGIPKSEVYRFLERCLQVDLDGQIVGLRGLVPGLSLKPYRRRERVKATSIRGKAGFSGAFLQLVGEHQDLHRYLVKQVRKYADRSDAQIARIVKGKFLELCAKHRAPNEYPFTAAAEGARPLARYIARLRREQLATAIATCPDSSLDSGGPRTGQPTAASELRPYEEVELDGHQGDFYFVLKLPRGNGDWIRTLPLRIWLVVMIDRASRSVLGYSYRLGGTNYSAKDVLRCILHAMTPWVPKEMTLPGLDYSAGAGFPSSCTPKGEGRLFDALQIDNAWANTARTVRDALLKDLGATVNVGRAATPTARPFVERLNKTLEDRGFRKLPIGFEAMSKEDRERAYKTAAEVPITVGELEQLLDVIVANYNADVHGEHTNRSPLEFLRQWDANTEAPIRITDDPKGLLERISRFEGRVKIKGGSGRLPYFRFKDADYTCTRLKALREPVVGLTARVIGSYLGDARFVRVFLDIDGREIDLGIAQAMAPWHDTPLTFEQRRLAAAERRRGRVPSIAGMDAGAAFLHLREREAAERKRAATKLAQFGSPPGPRPAGAPAPRTARSRVPPENWIKIP